MTIYIPSPLRSYTSDVEKVHAEGATVDEVLRNLNKTYPGIRFRIINEQDGIREHIKIFVNEEMIRDVSEKTESGDKIHIICALSGG